MVCCLDFWIVLVLAGGRWDFFYEGALGWLRI